MALSSFSTPFNYPAQFTHAYQGQGINPYAFQQYAQNQPLMSTPLSSTIGNPAFGLQPLQQVLPLLQIVPQQLQHLQQLAWVQLQELQQLQQIVQLLPGQLQQLQQLIQFVPQQHQQFQQPFGQGTGLGGFASTPPWGIGHQAFGAPPSHVM